MRKTEPLYRAPPTSNSVTASFAVAASERKPTSSANAPHYLRYASHQLQQGRSSPPGGPGKHPGPSGRKPPPFPPTPRRTGPTLDGTLDPGLPTPNSRSARGLYPPNRSTDPSGNKRAATCVIHLWSLYQEALADYSLRELAPRPLDDDDPPAATPMSPSPRTPPSSAAQGPLRHLLRPGPPSTTPPRPPRLWAHVATPQPDKANGNRTPLPATGREWDPPPTTTTRHPQLLGLPPGGEPRLNSPHRPRAQEDTL